MSYGFSNGGVTPVKGGASAVLAQAKTRKRAKHVFDTGQIPHLWMHKTQSSARNKQGNLYFEGDVILSYGSHFPIARHVTRADALEICEEYNSTHEAGRLSLKAEFEEA